MVKRSQIGILGGLLLKGDGLSVGPVVLGRFSRVRRAASRLQLQSEEPVVAGHRLAKTATVTMLARSRSRRPSAACPLP